MELIKKAAQLRYEARYMEAIGLIEEHAEALAVADKIPALLQALYAAEEAQLEVNAEQFANRLRQLEPSLPSLQRYG
ncbi:hypothetical protein [Massilia endophytica]|uniref:hypothetical protein n=1 Tax=Massilia endophytica TaxID=2899220 RepID=UPI001E4EA5E6|nr:hypothetical protein [Massilia endophytica]UGQ48728.1 hypothetical protein LSQ66_09780 [Massilia endophytica]